MSRKDGRPKASLYDVERRTARTSAITPEKYAQAEHDLDAMVKASGGRIIVARVTAPTRYTHRVWRWANESTVCGLIRQGYLTDEDAEVTCPRCKEEIA